MDYIENKSKIFMNDDKYDKQQYYIIALFKQGFNNGIEFFNLYKYFLKVKF